MNTFVGNIQLTDSQQNALNKISEFIKTEGQGVFILKGYAGTGKTTLVRAIIQKLDSIGIHYFLLASTGRAAKVLSDATHTQQLTEEDEEQEYQVHTKTIHSQIYKFDDINQDLDLFGQPTQNSDLAGNNSVKMVFRLTCVSPDAPETVYIIDESSMVSDAKENSLSFAQYGTDGRLLHDLIRHDPSGKFIFIGDDGQLPPPSSPSFSPALNPDYIQSTFNIPVSSAELKEIMRQSDDNDIVYSAAKVRTLADSPAFNTCALFPFKGYHNIHILKNDIEMLRLYLKAIKDKDYTKATLITLSNKSVTALSEIIRPTLGFYGNTIAVGDLLLVTQNNLISGLMNGDLVKVIQVGRREKRAGLTFVFVEVMSLATEKKFSQLLIEDVLYSNGTNLSQAQQTHLIIDFHYRMKELKIKQRSSSYVDNLRKDNYLNALRCVFGYALTCHKAQGGEWDTVFLMIPRNLPYYEPRKFVYQWVYTAMTRAKKDVYVLDDYWVKDRTYF